MAMSFYVILGVRREASVGDIKRAYRRLARRFHPDINPGDRAAAQRFREIAEAYEVLSDPLRRQAYDAGQTGPAQPADPTFAFAGFDFTDAAEGHRASTFGDLFGDVLRAARVSAERGADLHETIALDFDEAVRGTRRAVRVTRLERCAPCRGRGVLAGAPGPCPVCDGRGEVRGARGHMVFARRCAACGGAGQLTQRTCGACGGEGLGVHSGTVTIDLPAGLADGASVSVPGQGHAGRRGGAAGDLFLTVSVRPHRFFGRVGDDLHLEVPLAVHEAALGARIDVPTLEGPVRLRVPPGTQAGQVFRLPGAGIRSPRTGVAGDLVVTVRLVLPATLDERSKELLRQFGDLNAGNVRADLGV
jgi:molecular chaperone DnaJ